MRLGSIYTGYGEDNKTSLIGFPTGTLAEFRFYKLNKSPYIA